MILQEISDKIRQQFPEAVLETKIEGQIDPFIKISPPYIKDVCHFLRNENDLQFDFLNCLSGVDYGKGILGVVYNISSLALKHKATIKVEVPVAEPKIHSVESIWKTANWHEREAYDLLGIQFTGHPDMRRILLPYDWEGFPLRKDYKVPEFYNGMKIPY
ncbi:MAG: NADH-quinone oxidoreductase subunit C [Bacteroidota bacterium]